MRGKTLAMHDRLVDRPDRDRLAVRFELYRAAKQGRRGLFMDIDTALSEPGARLIEFQNRFNRNIKVTFGSLEAVTQQASVGIDEGGVLPTGGEPWGTDTRWQNLVGPSRTPLQPLQPRQSRCAPIPNFPLP